MALQFDIQARSQQCGARSGCVTTPHGSFDTPAFMPVGTQASVKGLLPDSVSQLGAQIILGNTFHLLLRPGSELVAEMGGLHRWMRWNGPILTDSGGFQVFSLGDINKINDDGVVFKSPLDGREINLTPERSMQVQNELGADIIMAFDDCPPAQREDTQDAENAGVKNNGGQAPASLVGSAKGVKRHAVTEAEYQARVQVACERSIRWLDRCVAAHGRKQDQALFGIVQGGTDLEQRTWCAQQVLQHDLPGFAIGGVAVGEGYDALKSAVEHTAPLLPDAKPRYLMGVGYERDIVTAVRAGVDMFDCVLPTRLARHGTVLTDAGRYNLTRAEWARSDEPLDPAWPESPAARWSRGYLRHLLQTKEPTGARIITLHNVAWLLRFMDRMGDAIRSGTFESFRRGVHDVWGDAKTAP